MVHQVRQDLPEHLYHVWVCFRELHYVLFAPMRAPVVEWLSLRETGAADVDSQLRVGGALVVLHYSGHDRRIS